MEQTRRRGRGFPIGTPRNRLSQQQRAALIEILKLTGNGAAATRLFNLQRLGKVSLTTVCTIRIEAIKRGELPPRKKSEAAADRITRTDLTI